MSVLDSASTSSRVAPVFVHGLRTLFQRSKKTGDRKYDAVFLDQYGVLHDGTLAHPEAQKCMRKFAKNGVQMVVISNSCQVAGYAAKELLRFGIDSGLMAGVVTSGELIARGLRERPEGFWKNLGTRCVHINWTGKYNQNLPSLGIQLEVTNDPTQAEFVLMHGIDAIGTVEATRPMILECLRQCAQRKLPLICANPDRYAHFNGRAAEMPGLLADIYAEMGGPVHIFGKPDAAIYDACLSLLNPPVPRSRVLAIGDSLQHDVHGASSNGIDCAYVSSGVDAPEMGLPVACAKPSATTSSPDGSSASIRDTDDDDHEEEEEEEAENENNGQDDVRDKYRGAYQLPTPEAFKAAVESRKASALPTYVLPHFQW